MYSQWRESLSFEDSGTRGRGVPEASPQYHELKQRRLCKPPGAALTMQSQAMVDLKAELGERFIVTDMVLIDRFPLTTELATALKTRRLSTIQFDVVAEMARSARNLSVGTIAATLLRQT